MTKDEINEKILAFKDLLSLKGKTLQEISIRGWNLTLGIEKHKHESGSGTTYIVPSIVQSPVGVGLSATLVLFLDFETSITYLADAQ